MKNQNKNEFFNGNIIDMLQNVLSYKDYTELPQTLNISRNRFTRIESSQEFEYDELKNLMNLLYSKFATCALLPEPGLFIQLYKQTHITLDQATELNEMYERMERERKLQMEEA